MSFQSASQVICDVAEVGAAFLVVAVIAIVVRRHRPDAYRPLLAWAIAALIATSASALAYRVVVSKAESEALSISALPDVLGGIALVRGAVAVLLALVLARGLVAIAQPAKSIAIHSDAPYR